MNFKKNKSKQIGYLKMKAMSIQTLRFLFCKRIHEFKNDF